MEAANGMTYYEELGVGSTASMEEIHDAYKQLVRLLHPDRIQDEKARRLADCQMKRLNGIYAILSNVDRRHQYDLALRGDCLTLAPMPIEEEPAGWRDRVASLGRSMTIWTAAAVLVVLMLAWTFADYLRSNEHVALAPAQTSPTPHSPAGGQAVLTNARAVEYLEGQVHYWRRQAEHLRGERDEAVLQLGRLEGRLADLTARAALNATPSAQPAVTATPAGPSASDSSHMQSPSSASERRPNLTGHWYYLRPPRTGGSSDLYPPEFIEAMIDEQNGTLRGRYRARYRVSDRAISPDVMFQFSGKGGYESARLPWLGAGGARGEVRLRLLTQNSMEVGWIASELGSSQGLGSGTAVLVRRVDP